MKKIIYVDCYSGISGDMLLGALIDSGLPLAYLNGIIADIFPRGVNIQARKVKRSHMVATKVDVVLSRSHWQKLDNYRSIVKYIQKSRLSSYVKLKSSQIFERLSECEGKAHGTTPEKVSFEELGGADTIVDIVGAIAGFEFLKIDEIYASAINVGEGLINMDHGTFSSPGPVTSLLLQNIPIYSNGIRKELTTPTGAAILSTLAVSFGSIPVFKPEKFGMGAGDFIFDEFPNLVRIMIGIQDESFLEDQIYQIETHIDDMNPQIYESLMENLFELGALDVALIPIIMKKGRPGILLRVLCPLEKLFPLSEIILKETTSLGLRFEKISRTILKRVESRFKSSFGWIRVKKSLIGVETRVSPEYEDCKTISKKHKIPLKEVLKQIEADIQLKLSK